MYKYYEEFLENKVTPERKELIIDVIITLESMGHEAALDELNTVTMMKDDDGYVTLNRMNAVLDAAQDNILNNHGIFLIEGLDLYNKLKIVNTLNNVEHYIFPDQIETLLTDEYDSANILVRLVDLIEGCDRDYILSHIYEVSDTLIENLKALINEQLMVRGESEDYLAPVEQIKYLNKLFRIFGRAKFDIVDELIANGKRIGSPLEELIDEYFPYLDDLELTEVPYVLYGLIAISNTEPSKWNALTLKEIDNFTDNLLDRKQLTEIAHQIFNKMGMTDET